MFVQLIALVCEPVGRPTIYSMQAEMCQERKVLNTDENPEFDWGSCMIGAQWVLAQWKQTGEYSSPRFRVARFKCLPDRNYVPKGAA